MARIVCTVTNDLSQDQRMGRICMSLSKAGHEVYLVGRRLPNSLSLPHRPYKQIRLNCLFKKGKFFYFEYNVRLLFFLFRNQYDIINAVDLDTLMPACLIKLWRKTPCIYDAHEYFTETPEVIRRPFIQSIWQRIAKKFIPMANHSYTVGSELAQLMGKVYQVNFDVVRNLPLSKGNSPKPYSTDKKIILYQGMLNEGRGLETAVEAMKLLNGFELWLVGHGDIKDELEKTVAQDEKLRQTVIFHGFVLPDQLSTFTNQAWLGLNLLENKGLSYYYSLANKAFDYIQSGVPSIHMAFPEYTTLQSQYDVFELLDFLEPKKLAQLIEQLANDPNRYAQLQSNCYTAAQHLNWEAEEKKLINIYNSVASI